ncbi:MAG: glycosyltransferase family 4 protein [Nitrospinae bacterium]|nr:glycosyltransferase family 4 protein [Nitrospinota bacterium]
MNILHVLFSRGWGGMERYALEQARRMAAKGHGITFISRAGAPLSKALRAETGFKTLELDPVKYVDVGAMLAIRSIVKNSGVNVVHAHTSADLGLIVPALWGLGGVRLVFSNYMLVPAPKKDIYHRLEYGRVDALLAASEYIRKNAVEYLPVAPEKTVTLPYGLDLARFNPESVKKGALREKYGIGAAKLIGVISRLEPLKGQMEMIEAMPAILNSHPESMLVLTGDETPELAGQYRHVLEAKVDELGVGERVLFTGATDDTAAVLADLDIYVLPSHGETFSLGCLEAMAMGKAVVGTNSGGTPEMLDNGGCGLLAEPKDPGSLAKPVIKLLDGPALAADLSAKARRKVVGAHGMEPVMDRLSAIYEGRFNN